MSAPSNSIAPVSGFSKPAIMRRVVVLPQPEGPNRPKNSPCSTSRETSATARVAPKFFEMLLRESSGILVLAFGGYPFTSLSVSHEYTSYFAFRPRISVSQYLNHSPPSFRNKSQLSGIRVNGSFIQAG